MKIGRNCRHKTEGILAFFREKALKILEIAQQAKHVKTRHVKSGRKTNNKVVFKELRCARI